MHAGNLRAAGLVTSQKNAQGPRPPGVISSFEPRMVWIRRRAISVRGILVPCLVFGGVTGAAQALQVPRFAPQRRRTLQFPAVVDMGSLVEPDQADAASLVPVASIVQRPRAGATVAPPNECPSRRAQTWWHLFLCRASSAKHSIVDVASLSSSRPYGPDEISKTAPMKPDIR